MGLANASVNKFFNSKSDGNKYLIENFVVNEEDANSSVTILVNNIPPNSMVLDVGCAQGKFGEYLHEIKNCKMYGIEVNEAAVKYVRGRGKYEDVFCFNLEDQEKTPEYLRYESTVAEFDFIIIADVLEHLADPTTVLLKISQKLKYDGKVLISIPNIGHADIYLNLLNGVFNYSDLGILDNTHLKFFTKQSFAQWISQINTNQKDFCYDCNYLGGTFYYSDYIWNIKDNFKHLFNIIEENPDFNVLQLLFTLTKLHTQSKTPSLVEILSEQTIDIVNLLNNAIGSNQKVRTLSMYAGERQWYEGRVDLLNDQVFALSTRNAVIERDMTWLKEQNNSQERNTVWLKEQNTILERDMNWLKEQNILLEKKITGLNERNSSQERNIVWLKEQNTIFERDVNWLKERNSSQELIISSLEEKRSELELLLEIKSNQLETMATTLSARLISRLTTIIKRIHGENTQK